MGEMKVTTVPVHQVFHETCPSYRITGYFRKDLIFVTKIKFRKSNIERKNFLSQNKLEAYSRELAQCLLESTEWCDKKQVQLVEETVF